MIAYLHVYNILYCKDIFSDFIYSSFIIDLYLNTNIDIVIHKVVKGLQALLLLVISLYKSKKYILSALFMFVLWMLGSLEWYTYMPMLICIPLVLIKISKINKVIPTLIICMIMCLYVIPLNEYIKFLLYNDYIEHNRLINDINDYYIKVDNHTLYSCNLPSYFYILTENIPQYKYFYNQDILINVNHNIENKINDYVETSNDALLIYRTLYFPLEQIGNHHLVDMYYDGSTLAIYEYIPN